MTEIQKLEKKDFKTASINMLNMLRREKHEHDKEQQGRKDAFFSTSRDENYVI